MLLIIKSWPVCIYATLDPTILLNIYKQNTKWWGSELDGNFTWTLFFLIWYFSKLRQRPWFANSSLTSKPWINQWIAVSNCETYLSIFKNPTNAHQQHSPKNTNSHLQVFVGARQCAELFTSIISSSQLNEMEFILFLFAEKRGLKWFGIMYYMWQVVRHGGRSLTHSCKIPKPGT